jgi:hypothetical protein
VVLEPYAVLVLVPTAGSGVLALAVDRRDALLEEGVAGMSLSERAGEAPLLLVALLVARVVRLVDMMANSIMGWRIGMIQGGSRILLETRKLSCLGNSELIRKRDLKECW